MTSLKFESPIVMCDITDPWSGGNGVLCPFAFLSRKHAQPGHVMHRDFDGSLMRFVRNMCDVDFQSWNGFKSYVPCHGFG